MREVKNSYCDLGFLTNREGTVGFLINHLTCFQHDPPPSLCFLLLQQRPLPSSQLLFFATCLRSIIQHCHFFGRSLRLPPIVTSFKGFWVGCWAFLSVIVLFVVVAYDRWRAALFSANATIKYFFALSVLRLPTGHHVTCIHAH